LHDSLGMATHTSLMDGAEMEALMRQIGWTRASWRGGWASAARPWAKVERSPADP
jgi:hypothetical protein